MGTILQDFCRLNKLHKADIMHALVIANWEMVFDIYIIAINPFHNHRKYLIKESLHNASHEAVIEVCLGL